MTLFLRSLFFFVAALLVLAALALVATWAPDQPVEALKPRWAQPPSQFITIDGMQVHLRDEGPR
ncbi:MAG: alpha/beta hydrolase, partial [Rubrivivax sp.]|nr:alpha/beta hydrolase [Rubrivivax sp.]